jgi:hypothetical protein
MTLDLFQIILQTISTMLLPQAAHSMVSAPGSPGTNL